MSTNKDKNEVQTHITEQDEISVNDSVQLEMIVEFAKNEWDDGDLISNVTYVLMSDAGGFYIPWELNHYQAVKLAQKAVAIYESKN